MRLVVGLSAIIALLFFAGSLAREDRGEPGPRITVPTAREPGQLETLLINPASGAAVPLWRPEKVIAYHDFSPDGRWLVYSLWEGTSLWPRPETLYRADLSTPRPEPQLLVSGSFPLFSPSGALAFNQTNDIGEFRLYVLDTTGIVHQLSTPGVARSWSPDGRWLIYTSHYQDVDLPISQMIVDTKTWQEHEYARSMPCSCNANPRPQWSPDSTRFLHMTLHGTGRTGRSVMTQIYDPTDTNAPIPAVGGQFWLDSNRYVAGESSVWASSGIGPGVYVVDAASGVPTEQPGGKPADQPYLWSPDRTRFVASNGVTSEVFDAQRGTPMSGILWGWASEWSSDGRFLLTQAEETDCGPAVMVHRAPAGEYLYCGGNSESGVFSPDSTTLAYLRTEHAESIGGSNASPTNDVYLIDLDDGSERLLVSDLSGHLCPFWSPDGRWLLVAACGEA